MRVDQFDFDLPEERIALRPADPRESARLLQVSQSGLTDRRVADLPDLGDDLDTEAPKHDPRYYFRPFKTILVRTVADGGESFYVRGEHQATVPALYDLIDEADRRPEEPR